MAFALDFNYARLAWCTDPRSGGVIDGDIIEPLVFGRPIRARKLRMRAREITPSARITMCVNALPQIDSPAAMETVARFRGPTIFVGGEWSAAHDEHLAIKDCSIRHGYAKSDDAIAAFTHIVLDHYATDLEA
jgi:hypothetical protein